MITAAVVTALIIAVAITIRRILFAIGKGLCWIVGFLYDVFEMVAGLKNISYGRYTSMPLIKIFFTDSNINIIYWGMALIGIVMCFGFAIFAVIRKSGDAGDHMKHGMGDILRNCFKGITLILLMNFIMTATINVTGTLLDRIDYLMVNAQNFDLSYDVTFSPTDYAAMGRCLNTIGNYSINASYNSRYNLNSCYNSIRGDLKQLADNGKFDVTYITTVHEDGTARTANTWQSVLQNIYRSVDDISVAQPLDEYNSKLADALLEAMDVIRNDASFEALEKYHVDRSKKTVGENVHLDRMIMLIGSMYGTGYSMTKGTGFTDYIRGPYYYGEKELFDYDVVADDFDMAVGTWLYLTVIVVAFLFIKEMLAMVFNATARIFNMLLLYISAPPFIAVTPLDDGGKLKQWTTAFIIQSLGLFGTVISLRLAMMFIPMIFNGDFKFFDSARMDTITRVIIMYGTIYTSRKASGMIVGILADNAGYQAIQAGDVGSEARSAIEEGVSLGKTIGGFAVGLVGKGLGKADEAVDKKKAAKEQAAKEKGDKGKDNKTAKLGNSPPQNMLDVGSKTSAAGGPAGAVAGAAMGAVATVGRLAVNGARTVGNAAAGTMRSAGSGAGGNSASGGGQRQLPPGGQGQAKPSASNPGAGPANGQQGNNPGANQGGNVPAQVNPGSVPSSNPQGPQQLNNAGAGPADAQQANNSGANQGGSIPVRVNPASVPSSNPQGPQEPNNAGANQSVSIPNQINPSESQPGNPPESQPSNPPVAQPSNPPVVQPNNAQVAQPSNPSGPQPAAAGSSQSANAPALNNPLPSRPVAAAAASQPASANNASQPASANNASQPASANNAPRQSTANNASRPVAAATTSQSTAPRTAPQATQPSVNPTSAQPVSAPVQPSNNADTGAAQNTQPPVSNNYGRYSAAGSATYEDTAASERNRTIPDFFK